MKNSKKLVKAGLTLSMALFMTFASGCSFLSEFVSGGDGISGNSTSSDSASHVDSTNSSQTASNSDADSASSSSVTDGASSEDSDVSSSGSEQVHEHALSATEAKSATCVADGNIAYWYCADCGKYFTDEGAQNEVTAEEVKTTNGQHALTKTEATEASCTVNGNIAYWHCTDCGKYFTDETAQTEIDPDGLKVNASHTLQSIAEKEATCEEAGNKAYWFCTTCNEYFIDESATIATTAEEVVLPAGHALTAHSAVSATIYADGNKEYWTCDTCGKYFEDEEAVTETSADGVKTSLVKETLDATQITKNATTNLNFWDTATWYAFGSNNLGSYKGGTGTPELKTTEDGQYLQFTSASRFDFFYAKDTETTDSATYCHLGDNAAWKNDAHKGLYDYEYFYSFDVSADGAFTFVMFGMGSGKADLSAKDGQAFTFDGNTITLKGTKVDNGAIALQATATLAEGFNFADGKTHNITFGYNRYSYGNAKEEMYVDGVKVSFVKEETGSDYYKEEDGAILHTTYAYDMGQRLSVIPQINSEEGAETTTYSTVCIYGLNMFRAKIK